VKVISLFSGAGGMDLGFQQAGYDLVWANELWDDAVKTYALNLGGHVVHRPIEQIRVEDIPNAEVLIGGFPCQGFSVANRKRHVGDVRNSLYLQYLRVLAAKQPYFFFAENVKGILSLGQGEVFRMIRQDFSDAGYFVQHATLNAADYGVPQRRERVFIFGTRRDLYVRPHFPPPCTHSPANPTNLSTLSPWVTAGGALANIPDPDQPNDLLNHEYTRYKLRFNGHQGHRRTNPDLPSPTITARGDDKGGVVIHHHPNNLRRLSAREAATLQTFPLDYAFYGTKTSAYRQIANAVPPLLAKAIASWLLDIVKNSNIS
jgi:DNA (cytosine-5)-methyltransferase 1